MTADGVQIEDPRRFDDWQEMIAKAFFAPDENPPPIILFLDEEEVGRLWPDVGSPVDSLVDAVRDRLDLRHQNPFRHVNHAVAQWHRGDLSTPPPCLPLLAVTVLAATRMRSDGQASSAAYYLRLAQLLWNPKDSFSREDLQQRLNDSFGDVAEAWQTLDQWIEMQSDQIGVSTIQPHHRLTRIGYPLSQALIRGSDRDKLTSFFKAIGRHRLSTMPADALLRALQLWNLRERGFSAPFCRSLDAPDDALAFGGALYALARSWNGEVVTEGGRRRLTIRLSIDLDEWAHHRLVRVAEGLDSEQFRLPSGAFVTLQRPEYGDYYTASEPLDSLVPLGQPFRAVGSRATLVQDPRAVWVLRVDQSNGRWVSESSIEPYRTHIIAVQASFASSLETALHEVADPGWRQIPQRKPLLPGYAVFEGVTLSDSGRFEAAAKSLPLQVTQSLRPDTPPIPLLVDGLPVASALGSNHYLVGGEPKLLLPVGESSRRVDASLDGVQQAHRFRATGFPIPLQGLHLEEGEHRLEVDGLVMTFVMHGSDPSTGIDDPPFAELPSNEARPLRPAVHIRWSRDAVDWLVSPDGIVLRVDAPPMPQWMEEGELPSPYYHRVGGEFAWHVAERGGTFRSPPKRLGAMTITRFASDPASTEFWRRAARQEWPGAPQEWVSLVTAAALSGWAGAR